jgi:nitrite reductase (cytochrome c-552)
MLDDQRDTRRVTERPSPARASTATPATTVAYREVGIQKGAPGTLEDSAHLRTGMKQLFEGFEEVCHMPYAEATKLVEHPVTCLDCHDPKSYQLRITKPGFLNGIRALAASATRRPTSRASSAGARAIEPSPTTPTPTPAARSCAAWPAPSATWSTTSPATRSS